MKKLLLSLLAVSAVFMSALAQNRTVQGTVTDADGAPIAGATVVVEGTSTGTTTDAAGHYTIAAPSDGQLNVSFIGYKEQTVAIAGKTTVDVALDESHTAIDDVIIVAYGQTTKEAFTGSASVVRAEDITMTQTSNVMDALNGKVAGVQIVNNSGQPGNSAPTILVRGLSSINASQTPLIILDGMSFAGDWTDINPADIESMSVLKDAAATALYGARGANGVILINTKRAKTNDAIVTLDIKVGVNQRAQQDYDWIKDPALYYETHYAALRNYYQYGRNQNPYEAHMNASNLLTSSNGGGLGYNVYTVPAGQTLIGMNGKLNPNATLGHKVVLGGEEYWLQPDDWSKEIYTNGVRQEYNASIAAGGEKSNFFGSFGYLNNEGIVAKTGFERYSARLRADYQAKKWLKVGGNASYSHSRSDISGDDGISNSSGNIFGFISQLAPIYPLYLRDGQGNILKDQNGFTRYDYGSSSSNSIEGWGERPFQTGANSYGTHLLDKFEYKTNTATFNGFVDVDLYEGLKLTVNGAVSFNQFDQLNVMNPFYGSRVANGGQLTRYSGMYWSYTLQQLLSYVKTFGEKHTIDVLVGHENNYSYGRNISGNKTGLFSGDSSEFGQTLVTVDVNSASSEYNNEGYFGRLSYDYDKRFYVSGSYRRDASSRFHPDHRWGNFWSLGAAWVLSNEHWFNADWVNELKVKASYGSQGNDGIGSYLYADSYSISNDGTGKWALQYRTKGNPDITWETNGNFNAGVELAFWGWRFSGNVEYFNRLTTNMLSYFSVPSSLGYSGYWKNVGNMSNQGVEIELNSVLFDKKNFGWDLNLNMTFVKNKVTKLAEEAMTDTYYTLGGESYVGYRDGSNYYAPGLPMYSMLMKAYAGVAEDGQPLYYTSSVDADNNRTLVKTTDYSNADYFIFDTALPDVYGGFGTSFRLYGFDLGVNFVYQIGGKIYDSDYASSMSSPGTMSSGTAYHKDILKSWTPENSDSQIPRFQFTDEYTASSSDRFLVDASYLSLQNINFGYTLPKSWLSKMGVSKFRIYVACENVWLWSYRKGLDPRAMYIAGTTSGGGSTDGQNAYSPIRTISGGLNITF